MNDNCSKICVFASAKTPSQGCQDVERINPYDFYEMGDELSPLKQNQESPVAASSVLWTVYIAAERIRALLKGKPIEIAICKQSAQNLLTALDTTLNKCFPTKASDGSDAPPQWTEIPVWQWNYVRSMISTFEHVFSAEMQNATTYMVPRRGLYSTPALVNEAESAFPQSLLPIIPQKTRDDFHEAGRCLAFNLPTAAGFHACRAVEGVLEKYYQAFTGKTDTLHGWYDYIKALEGVKSTNQAAVPNPKTLHNLTQIKDFDRNPLMHPRETLTAMDARILFGTAEIAIIGMAQEIADHPGIEQPSLPMPAAAAQ